MRAMGGQRRVTLQVRARSDGYGFSIVMLEQPTKPNVTPDASLDGGRPRRERDDIAKPLMIPLQVIVRDELAHDGAQMTLTEWDDVPQAL